MTSLKYGTDTDRFLDRIGTIGGGACWEWTGTIARNGYGSFWTGSKSDGTGRTASSHRFSYELFIGPIPEGAHLDHLCRNRACVNPAHLEPVTPRENLLRGYTLAAMNAAKTHCIRGHEFAPENLYIGPDGSRTCRQCRRDRKRAARERRRAA